MNSAFSAFSGILLTFAAGSMNALLHIEKGILLPAIGINLMVFSLMVYYVAMKQLTHKSLVNLISALDVLWVIGSILIVVLQLFDLSTIGYILIGVVALWIGYLAAMQYKYSKDT